MKRLLFLALIFTSWISAAEPLRVFIRSGPKSHGPGAHDHPRFLADWVPLLNSRGAVASGGNTFPTAAQLAATDVLVIHAQNGGDLTGEERTNLEAYLATSYRCGHHPIADAGLIQQLGAWRSTFRLQMEAATDKRRAEIRAVVQEILRPAVATAIAAAADVDVGASNTNVLTVVSRKRPRPLPPASVHSPPEQPQCP